MAHETTAQSFQNFRLFLRGTLGTAESINCPANFGEQSRGQNDCEVNSW